MTDPLQREGDRLARRLAQVLPAGLDDQARVVLLGRSLAVNLVQALLPTIEQISRRTGKPLHVLLDQDEAGNVLIEIVPSDGERLQRLPVADVLQDLLFRQGRLHPTVYGHLQDGLTGDEHHATRALVACLRSKPVLDAMQKLISKLLAQ